MENQSMMRKARENMSVKTENKNTHKERETKGIKAHLQKKAKKHIKG